MIALFGLLAAGLILLTGTGGVEPGEYPHSHSLAAEVHEELVGRPHIVEIPDINEPAEFTYAVWVYPRDLSSGQTVLGRSDFNEARNQRIMIGQVASNSLEFVVFDGGNNNSAAIPSSKLTTGQWHHVTVTYSKSSGDAAIYLNGEGPEGTFSAVTQGADISNMIIGAIYNGGSDQGHFDGIIDDFRYFPQRLTGSEILDLYNTY